MPARSRSAPAARRRAAQHSLIEGRRRKLTCTLRQLLRLLARVVLRVDVGELPWTDGADLYNRLFVDENIVRHAWRKSEETARRQGLGLALVGRLAHPQTECPGDHRDDLIDRMRVRSNAIARGQLEPEHKEALLPRIAE